MVRAILDGRKTQTRRIVKPQPKPFGKSSYGGTRQGWVWKPETFNRAWNDDDKNPYRTDPNKMATCALRLQCPYGEPGDRLWVKETHCWLDRHIDGVEREDPVCVGYPADDSCFRFESSARRMRMFKLSECGRVKLRPSIFMPRWASRITLEITAVRVERLQDITEEAAEAEGVSRSVGAITDIARYNYSELWDSINGPESWAANPWVWVVEFRRL